MDGDQGTSSDTECAWDTDDGAAHPNETRLGILLRSESSEGHSTIRHQLLSVVDNAPHSQTHLQDGDLVLMIGQADTSFMSHEKLSAKMQRRVKQSLLIHRPGRRHDGRTQNVADPKVQESNPYDGSSREGSPATLELIGRHNIAMPTDLTLTNDQDAGCSDNPGVAAKETRDPEEARLVDRERSERRAVYRRPGEQGPRGGGEDVKHGGGRDGRRWCNETTTKEKEEKEEEEEEGGAEEPAPTPTAFERCAESVEGESVSLVLFNCPTLTSRRLPGAAEGGHGHGGGGGACVTCGALGRCVELLVDVEQSRHEEVVLERKCCVNHATPDLSYLVFSLELDESGIVLWTMMDMCVAPRSRHAQPKAEARQWRTQSAMMMMYRYKSTQPHTGEAVVLGFSKTSRYLCCSRGDNDTVSLTLQQSNRENLSRISVDQPTWHFVFYRKEEPLTQTMSFESAAFPGWFMSSQSSSNASLRMVNTSVFTDKTRFTKQRF
uniref:Interleukin-1 n=1 Tax=Petromyzon marinus TaxID=7757 RepID=A0AAJ7U737_PETMA|nr:uncharacterized protein LOC116954507 [Petromyzon marinus]